MKYSNGAIPKVGDIGQCQGCGKEVQFRRIALGEYGDYETDFWVHLALTDCTSKLPITASADRSALVPSTVPPGHTEACDGEPHPDRECPVDYPW